MTRTIPAEQCAIIDANIRALRQRNGWTQARLGELMSWPTTATVCAAEGRRSGRQRGFTTGEIRKLAAIFDITPSQLTTRCATCGGHPRPGSPAWPAEPHPDPAAPPRPLCPARHGPVMRR